MERVDQSGEESSFAFPRRSTITSLPAPHPGIEQIPHGVAEHVESVDDNRQAKPWPKDRVLSTFQRQIQKFKVRGQKGIGIFHGMR